MRIRSSPPPLAIDGAVADVGELRNGLVLFLYWFMAASSSASACRFNDSSICSALAAIAPLCCAKLMATTNKMNWISDRKGTIEDNRIYLMFDEELVVGFLPSNVAKWASKASNRLLGA